MKNWSLKDVVARHFPRFYAELVVAGLVNEKPLVHLASDPETARFGVRTPPVELATMRDRLELGLPGRTLKIEKPDGLEDDAGAAAASPTVYVRRDEKEWFIQDQVADKHAAIEAHFPRL